MRQLEDLLACHQDMVELCRLKTRPPVIRDLVPAAIPMTTIYSVYRMVNQEGPPKGQLPQEVRVLFTTPKKRLHASAVLNIWERFAALNGSNIKRHIKTYQMYACACGDQDPLYDFNRVWFLIRQYEMRRIGLRVCPACGQRYAYNREDVSDVFNCHSCALIGAAQEAPSVNQRLPPTPGNWIKKYG